MKDFVQASKKISFLYHGIILASLVGEVVMLWQLERVVPVLYSGFIGFLLFHLVYHIILFVIAKRSGRLDYLVTWWLFLMFNLLYDSFLALVFLGLSFGMWKMILPSSYLDGENLVVMSFFFACSFQETCRNPFLVV